MESQFKYRKRMDAIFKNVRSRGYKFLMEHESKEVLKIYTIPTTRERLAVDANDAIKSANTIGYPVVLKICSPRIVHKSDIGGVIIGIHTPKEVKEAYRNIIKNMSVNAPEAKILGILVQEEVPKGFEVIVGAVRDPQFGPVVMFGLGGVFVEVLKDVSFRLAPLTKNEAFNMIKETKGFKILEGLRGEKPADLNALTSVITKVGEIITDLPEVMEIDINPLIVFDKGLVAVDARIVINDRL